VPGHRARLEDFPPIPPSVERAEDWLRDAKRHLGLARRERNGDHAESVAHSCKTIEFSAKCLLTLAGRAHPRRHDVGAGMEHVWRALGGKDREGVRLAKRQIVRVGWLCDLVEPLQNISEYGYAGKAAFLLVNEMDARTFYGYGVEAQDIAGRVLGRVKDTTFQFQ